MKYLMILSFNLILILSYQSCVEGLVSILPLFRESNVIMPA